MKNNPENYKQLTIPNLITCFRFLIAPILILIALFGHRTLCLVLFAISLFTDVLDGYIARILGQTSELGTKLDGWADLAIWIAALICLFILWPALAIREAPYALFAISTFILPVIIGLLKYKSSPSYHCRLAKIQAVIMSGATFLLLLTGISWPFRAAAIFQLVVAIEDISITILLPTPHYNIRSLWHAIKLTKQNKII